MNKCINGHLFYFPAYKKHMIYYENLLIMVACCPLCGTDQIIPEEKESE